MYTIQTLNAISPVIYNHLPQEDFTVSKEASAPDAVIVRSASMLEMDLPASLLSIARAGAGYNNIPVEKCTAAGICVFNTPGANANAVKELVLAGLLLASRDIIGGIEWAKGLKPGETSVAKQVEKGKSQFVGPEIQGKTLGVMGLGAVGVLVANAAEALGMKVIGYDPFLSVDNAWALSRSIQRSNALEALLEQADYVTIHIPLSDKTRNMIDESMLAKMKPSAALLNFSRAELCDAKAVAAALQAGKLRRYVVDFPTEDVLNVPGVIAIPHLGASTPESEDNCADMAAKQTRDYLQTGSIRNSVNLPACELAPAEKHRVTVIHRNIPNMISQITAKMGQANVNIEHMVNRSRGDIAYTVVDSLDDIPADIAQALASIEGVVRARVIC
ncbi:MAG: phosphoglycerate dehydrogenase [Candidatus Spyradocola sp.]|jgi:D-3-phosphoglycerate dehydrogenase